MNEEQIRDAADTAYLEDYFPLNEDPDHHWDIFNNGFIKGARWHESLPLSDRLTESEKERIRKFYKKMEVDYNHVDEDNDWVVSDAIEGLESIFGKKLFTPTEQ